MNWWIYVSLICLVLLKLARANGKHARSKRTIIGYYPLCPRGCTSCSELNGCLTCQPHFSLLLTREGIRQRGVCVSACPQGYYGTRTKSYNKCIRCSIPNCASCYDGSYCTRCVSPYVHDHGSCIAGCPVGQHYSSYTEKCQEKVDCVLSKWSPWRPCLRNGQKCGYKDGLRTRRRRIIQQPSANGRACSVTTQSYRCRLKFRSCADMKSSKSDTSRKVVHRKKKRRRRRRHRRKHRLRNKKRRRRKWRRLMRKRKRKNRERSKMKTHLQFNTLPGEI